VRRGDLVSAIAPGGYGKQRLYLVVQSDGFNPTHTSFTMALLTSHIVGAPLFRITVDPSPANGLRSVSQVMIDKLVTLPRVKIGPVIGAVHPDVMQRVDRSLVVWLGLA